MAIAVDLKRRAAAAAPQSMTRHRAVGFGLAAVGLVLTLVTLVANIVAADQLVSNEEAARQTLAWSFGLSTAAIGTIKLGIGFILIGILVRLWIRVDSVKHSLAQLKPALTEPYSIGIVEDTAFGVATVSRTEPEPLPVHRMARTMWAPMLAMGFMALIGGLLVSFAWAASPADTGLQAWTQGLQFLGEGMLLAGISFLLGSILADLRSGGGEVQESLGVAVKTLKMPATAKAFIGLMAVGLMVSVAQFVLYLAAIGTADVATWFAWLGPLREFGLGLILAGIVLALVTIGNVLGFQFQRIRDIATTGR